MSVSKDDPITAANHNILINSVNKVFGDIYSSNTTASSKATSSYGWGNVNVSDVIINDIITADQNNNLINRIDLGVEQTGVSSEVVNVIVDDEIYAATYNEIESKIAILDTNRTLSVDATVTSAGYDGNSVKTTWSSAISVTTTTTFASYADARYFFNSGGQLRFSFDNDGVSDTAIAWADLFSDTDIGTLIFSYDDVSQTGSRAGNVTSGSGFYELTTTPTELYNINLDASPYTENDLKMEASRNASGTQIIVTFTLTNDDPQSTLVDGNTTCYIDHKISNDKSKTAPIVDFSITGYSTFVLASWTGS